MIIFENADFWVLHKPAGLPVNDIRLDRQDNVHNPDASGSDSTKPELMESDLRILGAMSLLKQQQNVSVVHPVHRLDQHTSGLLLVAKHSQANRILSQAFQQKQVTKHYIAITRTKRGAKPKKKQGWIKGDMSPSRNGNWKIQASQVQPAQTQFDSVGLGERYRFCVLRPLTGKTHQLRVAMKSIAMPIVGDQRYSDEPADRMYLHAFALCFHYANKPFAFRVWPDTGHLFAEPWLSARRETLLAEPLLLDGKPVALTQTAHSDIAACHQQQDVAGSLRPKKAR